MIARRSLLRELLALCAVVGGLLVVWSAPASAQREHVFSNAFGSEGSGEGQLSRPGGMAVDEATGDVYVIDQGNRRIEVFSSTGAYVSQFNGSASPTGQFAWPGETIGSSHETNNGRVAVDNSTNSLDPSKGDVYVLDTGHHVIDKFSANGAYIGQVTGTSPTSPFPSSPGSGARGVVVDRNGALWVQAGAGAMVFDQFNDALVNEYVSSINAEFPFIEGHIAVGWNIGLALDSEGSFYVGQKPHLLERLTLPAKISSTGEIIFEALDDEETSGLGVDLSSNDVYVDHETSIAAFSPSGSPIERFGSPQLHRSEAIAVNSSTGTVYASDTSDQKIYVFTSFVVPDVTTGSASHFGETSVTVGGEVNPDGLPVTSCAFEYGTSTAYGQSEPCSTSPGSGNAPVAVSANLKGLEQLTKYHFRLKVSNANGANVGVERTFLTPEPVGISEESVSDVSSTSALFSAQIDPEGADTTYAFEYGTSVSYGESVPVPAGDLGAGTGSDLAAVRAQDLVAEVTYHVRVAATNALGTVYGPDQMFTTQAGGGGFELPDGREWELVSPPSKEGASIEPVDGGSNQSGLIEAAADGSAITYIANGPVTANPPGNTAPGGPTQVLSKHNMDGWSSQDIATPHDMAAPGGGNEYHLFSDDFSQALVEPLGETPLSPEATGATPYLRDNGSGHYMPLLTANNLPPGTELRFHEYSVPVQAVAGTPDLSHVLLTSKDALTSNAIPLKPSEEGENIYEWSAGQLQLVNILPGGAAAHGGILGDLGEDMRHVISSDGSHVFWTTSSQSGGTLYMSDVLPGRAVQTVQVDAPAPGVSPPPDARAQFETASANGSMVFFLDEEPLTLDSKLIPQQSGESSEVDDLYVYDAVTGSLTDLSVAAGAGEQAQVQSLVLGASEDGSVVYFVAKGILASGAEPGRENLYVESRAGSTWSSPRLVAVLSDEDSKDRGEPDRFSQRPTLMTSRVSPNGQYLAFMSDVSLKTSNFPQGYDNRDANGGQPDEEVFLYDEATGQLRCVSCNPTGARPDGLFDQRTSEHGPLVDRHSLWNGRWLAASIPGWTAVEPVVRQGVSPVESRLLSDEGRLFFDSADALVPQDTNGREDAYEYEPQGVGSCGRSGGCVSLISSGTSGEESAFMDASKSGDDVFFLTASRLVTQDVDTSDDVYDAHVCSMSVPCVSAPVSPPECTSGDACKAAPSLQPAIFGAPASATFSGAGNVAPSSPAKSASTPTKGAKKRPSHGRRKAKRRQKRRRKGRGGSSRARKSLSARSRR